MYFDWNFSTIGKVKPELMLRNAQNSGAEEANFEHFHALRWLRTLPDRIKLETKFNNDYLKFLLKNNKINQIGQIKHYLQIYFVVAVIKGMYKLCTFCVQPKTT